MSTDKIAFSNKIEMNPEVGDVSAPAEGSAHQKFVDAFLSNGAGERISNSQLHQDGQGARIILALEGTPVYGEAPDDSPDGYSDGEPRKEPLHPCSISGKGPRIRLSDHELKYLEKQNWSYTAKGTILKNHKLHDPRDWFCFTDSIWDRR